MLNVLWPLRKMNANNPIAKETKKNRVKNILRKASRKYSEKEKSKFG